MTFGQYQLQRHYEAAAPGEVPGRYRGYTLSSSSVASSASVPSVTQSVSYSYDSAGRLQTIASPVSTARYRYGATGLLTEVRRYLDSAAAAADADYSLPATHPSLLLSANTYQPFGYGVLSKTNRVGDTVISKFGYTLNDLGQRTAMINTGTAFAQPSQYQYRYNEKGEVIAGNRYEGADPHNPGPAIPSDTFAYRFDDIGNRLTATRGAPAAPLQKEDYTANLLNQYTRIDTSVLSSPSVPSVTQSVSPVHDADGNLVSDTRWHYIWNAENRLIELETSSAAVAAGAPKQKLLFAYDYQGRRTSKNIYSWNPGPGTWNLERGTRFLYDGWNLVAEFSAQPPAAPGLPSTFSVLRSYLWGLDLSGSLQGAGGVGGLLTVSTHNPAPPPDHPSPLTHYPSFDSNGNVSEYLDSTGAIAAHFEYSPFGETLRAQISNPEISDIPFRFSTKYTDSETGHLYYGYRYYDTSTGRWLSRDPIEEAGGVNLYGFIENSVVNGVDPVGESDTLDYQQLPRGVWSGAPGDSTLISRTNGTALPAGGIPFVGGQPDFSKIPGVVSVDMPFYTGTRPADEIVAENIQGLSSPGWTKPMGTTAHHFSAYGKPTLQYVPTGTHRAAIPHSGGFAFSEGYSPARSALFDRARVADARGWAVLAAIEGVRLIIGAAIENSIFKEALAQCAAQRSASPSGEHCGCCEITLVRGWESPAHSGRLFGFGPIQFFPASGQSWLIHGTGNWAPGDCSKHPGRGVPKLINGTGSNTTIEDKYYDF